MHFFHLLLRNLLHQKARVLLFWQNVPVRNAVVFQAELANPNLLELIQKFLFLCI